MSNDPMTPPKSLRDEVQTALAAARAGADQSATEILRSDATDTIKRIKLGARCLKLEHALAAQQLAEDENANCPECEGEGDWAACGPCSERFGRAIDLRHAALGIGERPPS